MLSAAEIIHVSADSVDLIAGGVRQRYSTSISGDFTIVKAAEGVVVATRLRRFVEPQLDVASGSLVAAMPGTIRSVTVSVGDAVVAGQTVVVMEAMKMELTVEAAADGTVTEVHVEEGDAIEAGAPLVVIE